MRRVTLTFLIVFSSLFARSQIYIGLTEAEITSRVKPTESLKTHIMPDGVKSLALEYKENAAYVRRYYMDQNTNRCYLYVLQPKSQEALDTFVKFCNENYDKTSKDDQWMTHICLNYSDDRCVDDVDVRVQLRTVKATGTKMFFFAPIAERKG